MSRGLTIVDRTKLNMGEVTVLAAGGSATEVDMLAQVLAGFGVGKLMRAEDVQKLKDVVEYDAVDLTIIDYAMGAFACMEATGWIRRRAGDNRYSPVVLVAANVTPQIIGEARNAGFNYIISKPLTPRVMFERLVWMVRERRKFVEAAQYVGPDRRFRVQGPPAGEAGRRGDDLSAEVGEAVMPNMSQADIDAMMFAPRRAT